MRRAILEKLIDVASTERTTIFLSSHLLEEVDRVAEKVAILCRGRMVAEGDKDEIRDSVKRLLFADIDQPYNANSHDWILSTKQTDRELQIVARDLSEDRKKELTRELGKPPQVVDLSLEDAFAEYTA